MRYIGGRPLKVFGEWFQNIGRRLRYWFLYWVIWFILPNKNQPLPVVSFDQKLNLSHEEESFVETTNPNKRNKMVVLPDGSTVILQKGSKLKYFDSYNSQNREVYLSGEAFFEVVKNPKKPFLVFTKDIVTKVLVQVLRSKHLMRTRK
jgi:hypothetical protein